MRDGRIGSPASDGARAGYSIIELLVIVAIIGVVTAMSVPSLGDWFANQRLRAAARAAADALLVARAEAVRTGNNHVVFFGPPGTTDPAGTALLDVNGDPAPLLVLDDGPAATANCRIDVGESSEALSPEDGVGWGVTFATSGAPGDVGAAGYTTGATFADPANNPLNWVLFRPDGIPVVFDAAGGDCGAVAELGSGGGGFYVTNADRDYAVVLTPLGGVRVHVWRNGSGAWSS